MPAISPHSVGPRAQINANNIYLNFGAAPVLENISLTLNPTTRLAIVGENGRGKSTLLNVLAAQIPVDSGQIVVNGTIGIAHQEMPISKTNRVADLISHAVAQSLQALQELEAAAQALPDQRPGSEERYAAALERCVALDAWDAQRRVSIALQALEAQTDPRRTLSQMSVGQRYRVRLACLLGGTDDFLMLDEPTNHLDSAGLQFLAESLKTRTGGVVLVSHDRALLRECVNSFIDLDPSADGTARQYSGSYEDYRAAKLAEREHWEQLHQRQQQEHSKLNDDLNAAQNRLISSWRPPKGTGKHARASRAGALVQNVHRRREQLDAHSVGLPPAPQRFRLPELGAPASYQLLAAHGVKVAGRLETAVDLAVAAADRIVITGPNGAGKSTLLEVLVGRIEPTSGRVQRAGKHRVGYLAQEPILPLGLSAREAYRQQTDRFVSRGILAPDQVVSLSALGLLRPAELSVRIADLSMGQKRRLHLALVLAGRPHLLLLDEPTNHLSMTLVDELTEALSDTGAAVMISTHDRQLLRDTASWPRISLV